MRIHKSDAAIVSRLGLTDWRDIMAEVKARAIEREEQRKEDILVMQERDDWNKIQNAACESWGD